eukprot:TRINITY_DN5742_c0_g1_i1.p1 TRINITY_DN5742_c0_g1~~TRINITY_DN5742_c0_g1_i1.p1  ORF type:complete len:1125 (+),score=341.51 TRINITY_DN5742_c0_g1_i1:45-3419(+)
MGVPGFFPWLVSRYPRVITRRPEKPDNVYIDVNGLVHMSCQYEGSYDKNEARSVARAVAMIEEFVKDLDPQVLVYLAVDGPAPRAKSNQQRARRFTSAAAKAAEYAGTTTEKLVRPGTLVRYQGGWAEVVSVESPERRDALEVRPLGTGSDAVLVRREELTVGAADLPHGGWDSNAISVGTAFMDKLTAALEQWGVEYHKAHPHLSVLVSGVRTPGEGEHKFIDFIKAERARPASRWYKANATHVLVSGDTDLLFLALALHEPGAVVMRQSRDVQNPFDYLSSAVLREYVAEELVGKWMKCRIVLIERHLAQLKARVAAVLLAVAGLVRVGVLSRRWGCLVAVGIVALVAHARTHLTRVLTALKTGAYTRLVDVERIFDDFVAVVSLLGNDFMPHMPSAYANQGSLSTILNCYVRAAAIGSFRRDRAVAWPVGLHGLKALLGAGAPGDACQTSPAHHPFPYLLTPDRALYLPAWRELLRLFARTEAATFREAAAVPAVPGPVGGPADAPWQSTYYTSIHAITKHDGGLAPLRKDMCAAYLEAVAWVALYYLTPSVPSWSWYYRHHHAPTACDLLQYVEAAARRSDVLRLPADGSAPLQPLQQLMLILPPASFSLLPAPVRARAMAASATLHPAVWDIDETGRVSVPLLPFVETEDAGFDEPGPQPEVLATTHGAGYLAGGTAVPHPTAEGCYLYTPQADGIVHDSVLTPGTACPAITCVRRPCYIPWRAEGQEFTKVGPDAESEPYKLLLEFDGRTPSNFMLGRAVREKFGIPCAQPRQIGFKRFTVHLAECDVDKVRFIAERQLKDSMLRVDTSKARASVVSDSPAPSPPPQDEASGTPSASDADASAPASPLEVEEMWCVVMEGVTRAVIRRDITDFMAQTFGIGNCRVEFGRGVARINIPAEKREAVAEAIQERVRKGADGADAEADAKASTERYGGYMVSGEAVTLSPPQKFDPETRPEGRESPSGKGRKGGGKKGGGKKGGGKNGGANGKKGGGGAAAPRRPQTAVHPYELQLQNFFSDNGSDTMTDWVCHMCEKHNFGSNAACFRCGAVWDPFQSLPVTFRRGGQLGPESTHYVPDHRGAMKSWKPINIIEEAPRFYNPQDHPLAKAASEPKREFEEF